MEILENALAVLKSGRGAGERILHMNTASTATKDFMQATGAFWPDAHRDSAKMAKLGSAAHKLCGLDNVSVPFDFLVEAEVFGAIVDFRDSAIARGKFFWPNVKNFIIREPYDLKIPKDLSKAGRAPVVVGAIRLLKEELGGKVPINAIVIPPFTSLSSYLVDTVNFMRAMKTDPGKVKAYMDAAFEVYVGVAKLYEEAGADIITFHDMAAPTDNISPANFESFVVPYLKRLIGSVKIPTVLNICGTTEPILGKMVECGASAVAIDERNMIDRARVAVDKVKPKYPIIGNINAKKVIHDGTPQIVEEAVKKAIDDGVDVVSPGCDFWIETSTDHVKTFVDAVRKHGNLKA